MEKFKQIAMTIFFWLMPFVVGSNLIGIQNSIKNQQPVDLVSLTDKYDNIIAEKNAEIISLQEQSKDFEMAGSEDYDIQQLAFEYLTEKEEDDLWKFWRKEVCPRYHDNYYCNESN